MARQTRSANEARGEISLILGGEEFILRPSYEAIQQFEQQTGRGVFKLAKLALDGELTAVDMAIIATECIKAWGRATENASASHVNARKVGELMQEAEGGWIRALDAIGNVLANAAMGGYTSKGEPKPETEKK